MNLRIIWLLFLVLICSDLTGQKIVGDYYPYHCDELVLNAYRDSLLKSGVKEIFVFQNKISTSENLDEVETYIIWNKNDFGNIKLITDSAIYKTNKCESFSVFKTSDLFNSSLIDKLDKPFNFVTPVVDYRNRFIIYSNQNSIFSFQSGDFGFEFKEDSIRHDKRKEIADLIEKEIFRYSIKFEKEQNYKRLRLGVETDSEMINNAHDRYKRQ
jgi:hypothetical protein